MIEMFKRWHCRKLPGTKTAGFISFWIRKQLEVMKSGSVRLVVAIETESIRGSLLKKQGQRNWEFGSQHAAVCWRILTLNL